MAREQGDELGDEIVYTHPEHDGERRAYVPSDVVNLEARGWVRAKTLKAKPGGKAAGSNGEGGPA